MSLSIFYQNVRGLKSKLSDVLNSILLCNYDIICFIETWLNDSILISELFGTGFKYFVYRKDRDLEHYGKDDGGGVLIAVRTNLRSVLLNVSDTKSEDLTIRVNVAKDVFFCLTAAYFPPDIEIDYYEDFFERQSRIINDVYLDDKHYIVADFNKSCIQWSRVPNQSFLSPSQFQGEIPETIIQNMYFCNFYQFNAIFNHQNKLLDLLLTNDQSVTVVRDNDPLSLPVDVYHPPLHITVKIESLTFLREMPIERLNYYKANYDEINDRLSKFDWNAMLAGNLNEITSKFYNAMYGTVSDLVPLKVLRTRDYPIYFSFELIRLLDKKEKAHRNWKRFGKQSDYEAFSLLRSGAKVLMDRDERSYITSIEANIADKPKFFWQYTKQLRMTNSYPSSVKYLNQSSDDPSVISNLFANYFKSVYSKPRVYDVQQSRITDDFHSRLFQMSFTENEVLSLLSTVDQNKGAGPDDVPNIFIKNCSTNLAEPLAILFNFSLKVGIFPEC